MVLGIIIWSANITNFPDLQFPFESGVLTLHYGWTWYLTLFTGVFAFAAGAIIITADFLYPRQTALFFGIEPQVTEGILYQKPAEDEEDEEDTRGRVSGFKKTIRNLKPGTVKNYRTTRLGTTRQKRESTRQGDLPLEKLTASP